MTCRSECVSLPSSGDLVGPRAVPALWERGERQTSVYCHEPNRPAAAGSCCGSCNRSAAKWKCVSHRQTARWITTEAWRLWDPFEENTMRLLMVAPLGASASWQHLVEAEWQFVSTLLQLARKMQRRCTGGQLPINRCWSARDEALWGACDKPDTGWKLLSLSDATGFPSHSRNRTTETPDSRRGFGHQTVWDMGYVLIRHSAVNLRSENVDRAPKDLGVRGQNAGKTVDGELVLVVSVRCGKKRDITREWQLFLGLSDVQCWATRVRVMKCDHSVQFFLWHTVRISVHAVWVGVLFTDRELHRRSFRGDIVAVWRMVKGSDIPGKRAHHPWRPGICWARCEVTIGLHSQGVSSILLQNNWERQHVKSDTRGDWWKLNCDKS